MAIQTNFKVREHIYPKAYLKIEKIISSNSDIEGYEENDGHQILVWKKLPIHTAVVFIYGDEIARQNNAYPIHSFHYEFEYDLKYGGNIYKKAYEALEEKLKD
jgi:hypothetical protein